MENPTYHLEGIVRNRDELQDFTGPLNLILMLLAKNKIEIRDLRISEILAQYLDFISRMQEMDLELASEFVQMASHLVYIKTRTLLAGEEDQVSELEELMSSLEKIKCQDAYMSIKAVTPELAISVAHGQLLFSKTPEPMEKLGKKGYQYSHSPLELLPALAAVFSRGGRMGIASSAVAMPKRIVYGVKEKSSQLLLLLADGGSKTMKELYAISDSRSELIATFISILELCSGGCLCIYEQQGQLAVKLISEGTCNLSNTVAD